MCQYLRSKHIILYRIHHKYLQSSTFVNKEEILGKNICLSQYDKKDVGFLFREKKRYIYILKVIDRGHSEFILSYLMLIRLSIKHLSGNGSGIRIQQHVFFSRPSIGGLTFLENQQENLYSHFSTVSYGSV